jgi:hypothetical protein
MLSKTTLKRSYTLFTVFAFAVLCGTAWGDGSCGDPWNAPCPVEVVEISGTCGASCSGGGNTGGPGGNPPAQGDTGGSGSSILSLAHKYAAGHNMPCRKPNLSDQAYILEAQLDCRSFVTSEFPWTARYGLSGPAIVGGAAIACKDHVALAVDAGKYSSCN